LTSVIPSDAPHLPTDCAAVSEDNHVLLLHTEAVNIAKRVRRTLVRAARTTTTRDALVDEELAREHVVVEHVAIGCVVEEVPPIRQEGDVTILPVVEEEVVVIRRLILKEEVRLRRIRMTERHVETVSLREQGVTVTRTPIED
jgi:stress response protein YsnF